MIIAQLPPQIVATINPVEIISCPAVTTLIKLGHTNNPHQVANVQSILKNIEGHKIEVTGQYDVVTEGAVKIFQRKYMSETMAPWGATRPTGIINITTAKKLNQVGCLIPMTLNAAELDEMHRYKAKVALAESRPPITNMMGTDVGPALVAPAAPVPLVAPITPTAPMSRDQVQASNAAAVAESLGGGSVAGKFGKYFKGLFVR